MLENVTIIQMKATLDWLLVVDDSNQGSYDVILKDGTRKKLLTSHLLDDTEDLVHLDDVKISDAQRKAWMQIFPPKPKAKPSTTMAHPAPNHSQTHQDRSRPTHLDIPDIPGLVLLIRAYSGNPEWRNYWKNQMIMTMETHTACWNAMTKADQKGIPLLFHDGNFPQCFARVQSSKELAPGVFEIQLTQQKEYLPDRHGELEDEGGNPAFSWAILNRS